MAGKSILKRFNAFSTASRHHTSDFEPHDTFVENLPALSANALGFVMGHQALPLSQIQISTASGLPAEVLYPANGTKSIQIWKIIKKKCISNKKKTAKHLQIFRPPWDPPTSVVFLSVQTPKGGVCLSCVVGLKPGCPTGMLQVPASLKLHRVPSSQTQHGYQWISVRNI